MKNSQRSVFARLRNNALHYGTAIAIRSAIGAAGGLTANQFLNKTHSMMNTTQTQPIMNTTQPTMNGTQIQTTAALKNIASLWNIQ